MFDDKLADSSFNAPLHDVDVQIKPHKAKEVRSRWITQLVRRRILSTKRALVVSEAKSEPTMPREVTSAYQHQNLMLSAQKKLLTVQSTREGGSLTSSKEQT